tara:strand:+ start:3311 stop:3580 length:270 start_codon:yes stop_codon:yes gene_type:complete
MINSKGFYNPNSGIAYTLLTKEKLVWVNEFFEVIYNYYCKGNNRVYQWELQKELKFLNYMKSVREYTFEDADKLNSIKNLYNHIKNGTI